LQHDPADEIGVDAARRFDLAACRLLDLRDDRIRLVVAQLARGGELDREPTLLARDEPLELPRDVLDLPCPALLGDEQQEVLEQRLLVAGEVGEDVRLRGRLDLRVAQDGRELG
jgi:hypothetical protein